jgi:hypothetical protein
MSVSSDKYAGIFGVMLFVLLNGVSLNVSAAPLVWDTGVWGDTWDGDTDGDGVLDSVDAFPLDPTEWLDTDGDGIGNNADWDDDGDGVPDVVDTDPLDAENTNEINLPVDGTYKGGLLRSDTIAN